MLYETLSAPGVADSSPVPRDPSGSVIEVEIDVATVLVVCVPSTVFVPSIVVLMLAGTVFGPGRQQPEVVAGDEDRAWYSAVCWMLVNATESARVGRGRRVGEHRDADLAVVRRHAVLHAFGNVTEPAGALTFTTTVSVLVAPLLSVTVSRNSRVAGPGGAVKLGVAVLAPVRLTFGPTVWVHA